MIPLTVAEVAASTGAELWCGDPRGEVRGVSTDTRTLRPGELFLALSGPNHDGDRYAPAALRGGAAGVLLRAREAAAEVARLARLGPGVVLDRPAAALAPSARGGGPRSVLVHAAPRRALAEIAASYRARLSIPVVAVTGACGRATTRAILCDLLASRGAVAGSPSSHANDVGVPHTLLRATADTRWLVVEMGVDAPGGLGALCRTARPTAAVLTGTGVTRLPRPSLAEDAAPGPAAPWTQLVAGIAPDGFCVLPADGPLTPALKRVAPGRVVTFGVESGADVDATDVLFHAGGTSFVVDGVEVTSPLLGRHDLANLLAALAACRGLGVALADVLPAVGRLASGPWGPLGVRRRLERREAGEVTLYVDRRAPDAAALAAGVRTLAGLHGHARRVLVTATTTGAEGRAAGDLEARLERAAAAAGIDRLVRVAPGAEAAELAEPLRAGDVALLCGVERADELARRLAGGGEATRR